MRFLLSNISHDSFLLFNGNIFSPNQTITILNFIIGNILLKAFLYISFFFVIFGYFFRNQQITRGAVYILRSWQSLILSKISQPFMEPEVSRSSPTASIVNLTTSKPRPPREIFIDAILNRAIVTRTEQLKSGWHGIIANLLRLYQRLTLKTK